MQSGAKSIANPTWKEKQVKERKKKQSYAKRKEINEKGSLLW